MNLNKIIKYFFYTYIKDSVTIIKGQRAINYILS